MDAEQRVALLERAMSMVRHLSYHYDDVLRDVYSLSVPAVALVRAILPRLPFGSGFLRGRGRKTFLVCPS